jgi:hypothetical protein
MYYVGLSRITLISDKKQIKNLHLFGTKEKHIQQRWWYLLYCFGIIMELYFKWNYRPLSLVKSSYLKKTWLYVRIFMLHQT